MQDIWYVLPLRLRATQEEFKRGEVDVSLHTDDIEFRRQNLYLFRRPLSIYFRYEHASGKTTMIVQHALIEDLQPRILESFENIDRLYYLDNPFGTHGVGVSYALKNWKILVILCQRELKEIVRYPMINASTRISR